MSHPDPCAVVVICGDPGGASAMAPVLERLQAEGRVSVRALAYREARSVWSRRGLTFEEIPEGTSEADASSLLSESGATALAVGTSVNSVDLEKRFVTAARRIGTPSLALLDFWSSYVDRFGGLDGALSYVPDLIAVMDDTARAEMVEVGFEPARLVVTGQPAFDALPSVRARFTAATREQIRGDLGVRSDALLVAFASQPLAAVYGSTPASPAYLGFTEDEVLAALLRALQGVSQRGVRVVLALLPHPRQDPRTFEGLSAGDVEAVVSRQHPASEVAMASDLVVGMNSILLVEACYLGCPTLSLQPGLRRPDSLPTNRMGISKAVYNAADIDSEVAALLLDEARRRTLLEQTADFQVDVGAAERVVELIYGLCDGKTRQPAPRVAAP
jgi:hypothetical protein